MVPTSPPALIVRKRQLSEYTSTPPITNFFPPVKKQRSKSETHCQNVSQELDECPNLVSAEKEQSDEDSVPLDYSADELSKLLGLRNRRNSRKQQDLSNFEKLPKVFFSKMFNLLDLKSLSALSLVSTECMKHVRTYIVEYAFYRKFQLDYLDFMNSGRRVSDDDFLDYDPFYNCGMLIKSITITLSTETRAQAFLNICRNLHSVSRGTLTGFGRILDGVTNLWKFSERRVMIKAAILIDPTLHDNIIRVLTSEPGKLVGLELKVRSSLLELFLNREQNIENSTPDKIEFGAWLSILLQNFTEQYQGRLYYLLFGPTILCKTGEKLAWNYFYDDFEEDQSFSTNRSFHVVRTRMNALMYGIQALRVMSMARRKDMSWTSRKIYRLFLRVVDASSVYESWSKSTVSMALAIDPSGVLCDYLIISCDPQQKDVHEQYLEVAHMVCRVRAHIYSWTDETKIETETPSTLLSEPLHRVFKHLSVIDGKEGGEYYSIFLKSIWDAQNERISELTAACNDEPDVESLLRVELEGQVSVLQLLCVFGNVVATAQRNGVVQNDLEFHDLIREALLEQDEQLENEE